MGVPLHWVVQYCSQVRPYKAAFTWADCLSWITLDKFPTKKEADAFMETELEQRRHSTVGAALRVYPIYPSATLNKYRGARAPEALMEKDVRVRARLRLDLEEAKRQYQQYGEWYESVFKPMVPIAQIDLPAPWKELRYQDNKKKIGETGKMPPAFLEFHDDTKRFTISDGIHRINAAKDLGYTNVPAVVSYRRTYRPGGSNPTRIGYRVGEPQETNAKKLIEFEVVELGNKHLLVDIGKALGAPPNLESVVKTIEDRFGKDAEAMWLCDTPEWAEKRYGPGEAYVTRIPEEAIVACDLGPDGKLWIWGKTANPRLLCDVCGKEIEKGQEFHPAYIEDFQRVEGIVCSHECAIKFLNRGKEGTLATKRWRLRARADTLLKEIREERARL